MIVAFGRCGLLFRVFSHSRSRGKRGTVVMPTDVQTQGRAGRNNGCDLDRPVGTTGSVAGAR